MPSLPEDRFNTFAMKTRKYRRMPRGLSLAVQVMQSTSTKLFKLESRYFMQLLEKSFLFLAAACLRFLQEQPMVTTASPGLEIFLQLPMQRKNTHIFSAHLYAIYVRMELEVSRWDGEERRILGEENCLLWQQAGLLLSVKSDY